MCSDIICLFINDYLECNNRQGCPENILTFNPHN